MCGVSGGGSAGGADISATVQDVGRWGEGAAGAEASGGLGDAAACAGGGAGGAGAGAGWSTDVGLSGLG